MSSSTFFLTQPFCVDVVPGRDEIVVEASGDLDLQSAELLEHTVGRLRAEGHDRVVVDLHQVEFIDSTGLRVLIGLHRDAQREGRAISLVAGPPPVQRIFELTATHALFHWRD
ncbi:MAG: STAS domain-containing protein [Vicinamibacterales bacterium]